MPRSKTGTIKKRELPRTGKRGQAIQGEVRWDARLSLPPLPGHAKRRVLNATFKTFKEAEDQIRDWIADNDNGLIVAKNQLTICDVYQLWIDSRTDMRPKTVYSYKELIVNHILPKLGSVPVQELRGPDIQSFYNDKREDFLREREEYAEKNRREALNGHPKTDTEAPREKPIRGTGGRTLELCHERLKQILDHAVTMGLIARNPAVGLAPKPAKKKPHRVWSAEEIAAILSVDDKSGYGPIWTIMLAAGLRRSEALGLRWDCVDVTHRTLKIRQGLINIGSRSAFSPPKSESSIRDIIVPPEVIDLLLKHKHHQDDEKERLRGGWIETGLVFTSARGTPISPNNLKRDLAKLCKLAGIPTITVHEVRHTTGSRMMGEGANLLGISALLGHSRPSITSDIYLHVDRGMQENASESMRGVMFRTGALGQKIEVAGAEMGPN